MKEHTATNTTLILPCGEILPVPVLRLLIPFTLSYILSMNRKFTIGITTRRMKQLSKIALKVSKQLWLARDRCTHTFQTFSLPFVSGMLGVSFA